MAGRAHTALVQPVPVRVKAILDMFNIQGKVVLLGKPASFIPSLNLFF
ncbi:MAG TPA: hypothetical protein VLH86_02890 [Patescibacteria group bacterium]|nr:hypothetical protein [Patescibacteria group bacterium]